MTVVLRGLAACTRRLAVPGRERVLRAVLNPERPRLAVRARVKMGDGLRLDASTESVLGWHMVFLGEYEPEVRRLFRRILRPGRDAVDVGAHIGIHTLLLARLAESGTVVACEPNPATFRQLLHNVEINSLTNVRPFGVAVLDRAGPVRLTVPDPTRTANDGSASLREGAHGESMVVQGVTLDGLMAEVDHREVELIKIDVEGFEGAVLDGATELLERHAPAIVFEYWPPLWEECGYDLDGVRKSLRAAGYDVFLNVTPHGLRPIPPGLPRFKSILAITEPRLRAMKARA